MDISKITEIQIIQREKVERIGIDISKADVVLEYLQENNDIPSWLNVKSRHRTQEQDNEYKKLRARIKKRKNKMLEKRSFIKKNCSIEFKLGKSKDLLKIYVEDRGGMLL